MRLALIISKGILSILLSLLLLTSINVVSQNKDTVAYYDELYYEYKYINPDTTILILNHFLDYCKSVNCDTLISDTYNSLSIIYNGKRNYSYAIQYVDSAILYATSESAEEFLSNALSTKGYIYSSFSEYENALKYYQKALNLANKSTDTTLRLTVINNIASVQYERKDYKSSRDNFLLCLNYANAIKDSTYLLMAYQNLGVLYSKLNEHDKAKEMTGNQLLFAKKLDIGVYVADAYNNYSSIYQKEEKLDSSLWAVDMSLESTPKSEGRIDKFWPILNKGMIIYEMYKNNNKKEYLANAISYLDTAYTISHFSGSKHMQLNVLEIIHQYYREKNDLEAAYSYLEEYANVKDSLYSIQKEKIIQDYEAIYKLTKKEGEISDLNLENEKKQNENFKLQKKADKITIRYYYSLGIAISLILFVIIVLITLHFRRKIEIEKRLKEDKNKKLEFESYKQKALNERMVEVEHERNKISMELHDNISSKIFFFSKLIEKDENYSEFQKIGDSVRNLISNLSYPIFEDIVTLEESIVIFIKESFQGLKVDYNWDFLLYSESAYSEELKFDIYRITQELITNVIKHSKATKVSVALLEDESNKTLEILIKDNGTGYKPTYKGHGIKNINLRIKKYKGSIKFINNNGTEVIVKLEIL